MKLYRPVGQKTLWPLNSIYLSISPTNPSTYFGGTWVQLKNAFLFATNATSGDKGTGSGTGTSTGAATGNTGSTVLTQGQLPKIEGTLPHMAYGEYKLSGPFSWEATAPQSTYEGANSNSQNSYCYRMKFGNNEGHTHTLNSHTHTIPYIEIYVFKRTA